MVNLLELTNYSITFYIYCLFSEDFRNTLVRTLRWRWLETKLCKRKDEVSPAFLTLAKIYIFIRIGAVYSIQINSTAFSPFLYSFVCRSDMCLLFTVAATAQLQLTSAKPMLCNGISKKTHNPLKNLQINEKTTSGFCTVARSSSI